MGAGEDYKKEQLIEVLKCAPKSTNWSPEAHVKQLAEHLLRNSVFKVESSKKKDIPEQYKKTIRALECCKVSNCGECPFHGVKEDCEVELPEEALNLVNYLQEDGDSLFFTLSGVMWSVDKWLEGDELEMDEVNRGLAMREKTLKITEEQDEEIESLRIELNSYKIKCQEQDEEIKRLNSCVKSEDEVRTIMKSQMSPMINEIVNEQIDKAVELAVIKEIIDFGDSLKKEALIDNGFEVLQAGTIDNLVKQRVGVNKKR